MRIRVGYELIYDCPQPTPMMLMLHIHHSRAPDIVVPDQVTTSPMVSVTAYRDGFGNWCSRLVAPKGRTRIASTAVLHDSGVADPVVSTARQHEVPELPPEALVFLLGSRYCETDRLSETAWHLFGHGQTGWGRVQAICDFVHRHIAFSYADARPTRTAWEAFNERRGVCRDFAHLAVTLCRCMNIPARYCTGYLGDIGVPPPYGPMDFAAWFEAYLGGELAHLRSAQQRAAGGARPDGARARRGGCRDQQHVRPERPHRLHRVDRRGRRKPGRGPGRLTEPRRRGSGAARTSCPRSCRSCARSAERRSRRWSSAVRRRSSWASWAHGSISSAPWPRRSPILLATGTVIAWLAGACSTISQHDLWVERRPAAEGRAAAAVAGDQV